jgi:hypothetical protein
LSPGAHQIQAYSVDGDGNVDSSPASDPIFVQAPTHRVFLPLLTVTQ